MIAAGCCHIASQIDRYALYPSDAIIKLAIEKKIPFTTASDAHSHAQLAESFDRLGEKMSILGIREVCVYEKHKREVRTLKL